MATINSKKLLPSSTKGSAIEKPKFLVPVKNISTKKITGSDLKPIDKKSDTSGSLVVIKNKLIDINNVFKSTYLINKKTNERKRKESETQKSKERETKLEKKEQKTFTFGIIKSVPGGSIIDAINRFIGFTLLGYIFNNYAKYLPKLIKLGAKLAPAMKFFEAFSKTLLNKTITFVDLGYKAFDTVKKTLKDIGGKNYEKIFNDFSSNLNTALNVALVIAGLAISKKGPGEGGGAGGTTSFLSSLLRGKAPTKASDASIAKRLAARRLAEARRSRLSQRLQQNAKKARAAELARQLEPGRGIYKKTPQLSGVTQYVGVGGGADVRDPSVVDKLNKLLERSSPGELKSGTKKIKLGDLKSRGIPRGSKPVPLSAPKPPGVPSGMVAKGASGAKSFLKVASVPVVSALADFIISYFILKEKPGRAAASAIGSGIGTLLGTAATAALGLGTGGIGAAILGGAIIGGSSMIGSAFGTTLYDTVVGAKKSFGFAQGGQVTRGGKTKGAPSRTLKTRTRKAPPKIQPQKTQPGKDVGGKLKIEELYGKDEPGKRSALRALRKSSDDVKRMRSINGLAGSMFGAGIDMALGQKPDKNLSRNLGNIFGSVIASAVDMEMNSSFSDISKSIAMANGGVVPSRQIGRQLSIGERIGNFISRALAVSIENSASKILQNLRNEMNLQGTPGDSPYDQEPPSGESLEYEVRGGDLPSSYPGRGTESHGYPGRDYQIEVGKAITVFKPGTVVYARLNPSGYGNLVIVRHKDGKQTVYAHLSRINVKEGDEIKDGERKVIGLTGGAAGAPGAGNSTGPHLHFEVRNSQGNKITGYNDGDAYFRFGTVTGVRKRTPLEMSKLKVEPTGRELQGEISWYGPGFYGNKTANGEVYTGNEMTAAHKTLPFGTLVRVTWKGRSIVVRINDRGPYISGRVLDLSRAAAEALGMSGVANGAKIEIVRAKTTQSPAQLGKVLSSTNINGATYTVREGGKYFKNGNPITKDEYDNAFGLQLSSLAPSQSSAVASLNRSGVLKEDTSTMIYNNNAVAILPIEVTA